MIFKVGQNSSYHNQNTQNQSSNILNRSQLEDELSEIIFPKYRLPKSLAGYENYQIPISLMPPKIKRVSEFEINKWD